MGLALTLLHSPKLLILDEPTNGLDPAGIKHLRDILKDIATKENVAVFVSSHILTEMELMCDRVAVINKGKIVKVEDIGNKEEEHASSIQTIIEVKDPTLAKEILDKENYETNIIDKKVSIKTNYDNIPEVVKLLVKNDVDIYNVIQKEKSLEDIFFDATEGKKGGQKNEND